MPQRGQKRQETQGKSPTPSSQYRATVAHVVVSFVPLLGCQGRGEWSSLDSSEPHRSRHSCVLPLSLSAAFPKEKDMAKAQVMLRTSLSVQVGVREGVPVLL